MTVTLNIGIIGPGYIGSEFLRQIREYQIKHGFDKLAVIAIAELDRLWLHEPSTEAPGIDLSTWKEVFANCKDKPDLNAFASHLVKHKPAVLVDTTASQFVASQYPAWLKEGLHIVTPNKKAFSGDLNLFKEIQALSAQRPGEEYPMVFHESTVGAGLPVLDTLKNLVATGDKIVKIEGIFSGTLSYLFNVFSPTSGPASNVKFSDIVKDAKAKGYTEPDPRDDLNGLDVARKVTICGRLAGLDLTMETLDIENIVPEELRALKTADEFLAALPKYDDHFAKLNEEARKRNEVLRYVGVCDPNGTSSVKLMSYPTSHPFASLKGSDNIIAFTTERFVNPLIIIGAGAGDAVTAFGIFSDVLQIYGRVTYGR